MTRKRLDPDVLRQRVPKQDRGYAEISCTAKTKTRLLAYCNGRRPDDIINELLTREGFPMTTFRIEPMVPTGLIEVDHSASTAKAKTPVLRFDIRKGEAWLSSIHECEQGSTLVEVYNGLVLEWTIPVLTDAERFAVAVNCGSLDALLSRIKEGASTRWDGNNIKGVLDDDAQDNVELVELWLNGLPTLSEPGGLWEAGDWLVDGVDEVRPDMTDEELQALADKIEAQALADNVVLVKTLEYLKGLRDR